MQFSQTCSSPSLHHPKPQRPTSGSLINHPAGDTNPRAEVTEEYGYRRWFQARTVQCVLSKVTTPSRHEPPGSSNKNRRFQGHVREQEKHQPPVVRTGVLLIPRRGGGKRTRKRRQPLIKAYSKGGGGGGEGKFLAKITRLSDFFVSLSVSERGKGRRPNGPQFLFVPVRRKRKKR